MLHLDLRGTTYPPFSFPFLQMFLDLILEYDYLTQQGRIACLIAWAFQVVLPSGNVTVKMELKNCGDVAISSAPK